VSNDAKNCWYSAGLHFECIQCGNCCSGPTEGYIWVAGPEIRLIAQFLNITTRELKKKFLRKIGFRRTIIEQADTRDCIFLSKTKRGKTCLIYPVRPSQCRSWPFWPGNLLSPNDWNMTAQKCPGINLGRKYDVEQIRANKNNPLGGKMKRDKEIARRVEAIYNWLDEQIAAHQDAAGKCEACGKCCDFDTFGHRLFVTSPEMIYFREKIGSKNLKKISTGKCSYQAGDKCTVYEFRFAGCRIFCCKGDVRFQSDLTEAVIKKFKALCDEFLIPYRYTEAGTLRRLEDLL
jgi:Fe-S-cluster containining protein